jgi:hypothetical protein
VNRAKADTYQTGLVDKRATLWTLLVLSINCSENIDLPVFCAPPCRMEVGEKGAREPWPFQLPFQRWVDGEVCALRSCREKIDSASTAVVLVCSFLLVVIA